jgi:(p)ppGpp synthase/HD superfamily hydrolase
MSDIIKKALYFSAKAHDGQYRKGGNVPYFVHPVEVSMLCMRYTNDENIIAAAILHDVLEDCKNVTYLELRESFGETIANIVSAVSADKDTKHDNWRDKKMSFINKIKDTKDMSVLMVAACDKMVNMKSYFEAVRNGINVDNFFKGKKEDYVWYYLEFLKIFENSIPKEKITSDYRANIFKYK